MLGPPITVKLGAKVWAGNPNNTGTPIGGEITTNVEFQVGGRDDRFGFLEIFNYSNTWSEFREGELLEGIDIRPNKGSARAVIRSY